jgi:two-component system, NtrC family, sensor kinase
MKSPDSSAISTQGSKLDANHLETSEMPVSPHWFKHRIRRLSIGNKINAGYALVLSVALLGTTAALAVSNHYQKRAEAEAEQGHEAGILASELQLTLLQTRSHQQRLLPLLQRPTELQQEYKHFTNHTAKSRSLVAGVKSPEHANELAELQEILQKNEGIVETYLQQAEKLLQQIDPTTLSPAEIPKARQLLQEFTNSEVALRFDRLADQLVGLADIAFEQEEQAEAKLEEAQELGRQIAITGALVSIAIAIALAIYTTQLITRPITAATQVARKVTQESDFDLQVPVVTGDEVGTLATTLNQLIQRVKTLLAEKEAEASRRLIQAEKMSSLGRMIAGVAHEINNPVNFIYGNLDYANEYTQELLTLLNTYATEIPDPPAAVQTEAEDIDLEFLKDDLPKLMQSMKVGADRVRQIVLSLKDFARLDEAQPQPVDLHACIDSTLLILNNRIKKGITITRNYATLPKVEGYTGALYQVFMNILSNAIDALEDKLKEVETAKFTPQIIITTERAGQNQVAIQITDNGSGIPAEQQPQIFETFFTTKPRGVGTGLGLAISRQIVVEKHNGSLTCTSEVGQGSTFMITLPIQLLQISSDSQTPANKDTLVPSN